MPESHPTPEKKPSPEIDPLKDSKNLHSVGFEDRRRGRSMVQNCPDQGLFITGTDTDVGKTFVGAVIVRSLTRKGYRVGPYKPVASGCELVDGQLQSGDAKSLWEAAGCPASLQRVCPQRFAAPLAPNLAAAAEGSAVAAELLRSGLQAWSGECDLAIVEGAGGLYSPVSDSDFNVDLAKDFDYPVLIVAANRLGTINATLLSIQVAQQAGLRVAGVVLNTVELRPQDSSQESNAAELSRCLKRLKLDVPLLGTIGWQSDRLDTLQRGSESGFAWETLVGSPARLATRD